MQELQKVRERGYALDLHESLDSTSCVAVPVRNHTGEIIASLSFSGFVGAYDEEYLCRYLPTLNRAAAEISEKLFSAFMQPGIKQ